MAASDDAKQGKETKKSGGNRDAQRAQMLETPGLYWAVGPQPKRMRG